MEKQYFILPNGVVLEDREGELSWVVWMEEPAGETECILTEIQGTALITKGILVLRAWTVRDMSRFRSDEEITEFVKSLPNWARTDYFVQQYDIGGPILFDAKTGERCSEELHQQIMPKLGLNTEVPPELPFVYGRCPVCGEIEYCNIKERQWGFCETHKTVWLMGWNLFSSSKGENEKVWEANLEMLKKFTRVKPAYDPAEIAKVEKVGCPLAPEEAPPS